MTGLGSEFDTFHAANPQVYALFKRFTFEVIEAGHKHYSADAILHRIRWETSVKTKSESVPNVNDGRPLKINDHFSQAYARLFMLHFPERKGFFRTRALASERKAA